MNIPIVIALGSGVKLTFLARWGQSIKKALFLKIEVRPEVNEVYKRILQGKKGIFLKIKVMLVRWASGARPHFDVC